jgi:hypothetical protein
MNIIQQHSTVKEISLSWGWSSIGTSATDWPIVPSLGDYDGEFNGMKIGKGNPLNRHCPPHPT